MLEYLFEKVIKVNKYCSQEEISDAKKRAQEIFAKMNEPTAQNALIDMKMSQALYLTKDGKFYSTIANEYKAILQSYCVYCKVEKQESWNKLMESLIDAIGATDDSVWLMYAWKFECAAKIIEKLALGASSTELEEIVRSQGHTGATISSVCQTVLEYSDEGIEFIDNVVTKIGSINNLENLKKAYRAEKRLVRKKEEVKKKELYQRLVNALSIKIN